MIMHASWGKQDFERAPVDFYPYTKDLQQSVQGKGKALDTQGVPRKTMANGELLDLTLANDSDDDEPVQGNNTEEMSPVRSSSQSGSGESSDDEDDDDAIEVDPKEGGEGGAATGEGMEGDTASAQGSPSLDPANGDLSTTAEPDPSVLAYRSAIDARRSLYLPSNQLPPPTKYHIEPVVTIPHTCHVNALALPTCSSHIYTGGSDGFIRRYALHQMLNGAKQKVAFDNNLTTKPGGLYPQSADTKVPVLVGYWENEEFGDWVVDAESKDETKARWGPKIAPYGNQSTVYSLAIQAEELWGLSGTSSGTINLWTSRIDEGQIRHVFRSSDNPSLGHAANNPVSVLTLTEDERSVLSGGWDSRILQWDLDTGVAGRSYLGHTGQISSVAFRPLNTSTSTFIPPHEDEDISMEDIEAKENSRKKGGGDAPSPASSASSSTGVAAALVPTNPGTSPVPNPSTLPSSPSEKPETNGAAPTAAEPSAAAPTDSNGDADADGAADEDAEGEEDADGEDDVANPFAFPGATFDTPPSLSTAALPNVGTLPTAPSSLPSLPTPHKKLPSRNPALANIPVVGVSQAALPELSNDVFLSTSMDGQVMMWDRRVKSGEAGGVRRFESPSKGAYCASASWSTSGQEIYVGRRSSLVEIYDIRYSPSSSSSTSSTSPILQTLRMPTSSGPVSVVKALPSGKHLLTGSFDNIRLWDLELARKFGEKTKVKDGEMPYKIVTGHHGGVLSAVYVDPLSKFLISASGTRGWDGTSTENVIVHEIKSFR